MNALPSEAIVFLCFVIAILTPPFLAALLLTTGLKYERLNYPSLILSGLMIIVWVPLLITSPMILSDYILPALQRAG